MKFLTWTFQDVSIFFQMAGMSPMQNQVNHFLRYLLSAEPDQYLEDRCRDETRRHYRVLDEHLQECGGQNITGDRCTIAELATFLLVHSICNWSPRSFTVPIQAGIVLAIFVMAVRLQNSLTGWIAIIPWPKQFYTI